MAKRKAAPAANLPRGFKSLTGGQDGQSWQPEVGDTLAGVVVAKKTIDAKSVGRENAKKGEKVTIVSVADDDGVVWAVWQSKALEQFCAEVKPRQKVFLRLDGVKKIGKKRFKQFTAGIVS